jgi:hypothetical protein
MNLIEFLKIDKLSNAWITEPHMEIYVRKSKRYIGVGQPIPCLDVANIEVIEGKRGEGIFTAFLDRVEKEARKRKHGVWVESILDDVQISSLTFTLHSINCRHERNIRRPTYRKTAGTISA